MKFKKDIPARFNSIPGQFSTLIRQRASQLKIDTLQAGYDSLQIRIWYNYGLILLQDLLVIKRENANWTATIYNMMGEQDTNGNSILKSTNIKIVTPKNGWDNFINKLFALQVISLPDMYDIPGLKDNWADGVSYDVEIATKTQYRFYSYHMPAKFADKYWQAKNVTDILKLTQEELGIGNVLFTDAIR